MLHAGGRREDGMKRLTAPVILLVAVLCGCRQEKLAEYKEIRFRYPAKFNAEMSGDALQISFDTRSYCLVFSDAKQDDSTLDSFVKDRTGGYASDQTEYVDYTVAGLPAKKVTMDVAIPEEKYNRRICAVITSINGKYYTFWYYADADAQESVSRYEDVFEEILDTVEVKK